MTTHQDKGSKGAGVASVLERRFVPKGSVIIKQGETGTCAFLIQSGEVKVMTASEGRSVELARLGAGQIFGEMALVFDEPRTATVEALEDCNLIVITRNTFSEKLKKSDPTVRAIVPMLMKRIIQANNAAMGKQGDVDELINVVNAVYENIHASLSSPQHKRSLENAVLPDLDRFLKSVKAFQSRYSDISAKNE